MNCPIGVDACDACLLEAFLAADDAARGEFPARMERYLTRLALKKAPDLRRAGLIEDAVQRTWELTLQKSAGEYDPSKSSAKTWIGWRLMAAIRDTRDWYFGPRTRQVPEDSEMVFPRIVLTVDDIMLESGEPTEPAQPDLSADVAAAADAESLLGRASVDLPASAAEALERIYAGESLGEAAASTGLSRFSLRRTLDRWVEGEPLDSTIWRAPS